MSTDIKPVTPIRRTDTDFETFMADLNGGVFKQYTEALLSEVAAAVIQHDRAGTLQITFGIKKEAGNIDRVAITHELKYKKPKARGDLTESGREITPFFVGKGGRLTLMPEGHGQLFTKAGGPNPSGDPTL